MTIHGENGGVGGGEMNGEMGGEMNREAGRSRDQPDCPNCRRTGETDGPDVAEGKKELNANIKNLGEEIGQEGGRAAAAERWMGGDATTQMAGRGETVETAEAAEMAEMAVIAGTAGTAEMGGR